MESKHESPEQTSPEAYRETHRGFTIRLQFGHNGVRAVADGPVQWLTPWGYSWPAQLGLVRALVDRYVDAREACERIQARRELAARARYELAVIRRWRGGRA